MRPRQPTEPHRSSTNLELLFDLVFVVAVSFAAEQLARSEVRGDVLGGLESYLMIFFAIWWAWVNFTWFASAFDTDDWLYRVTTLLQMAGALVLAAGVPNAVQHGTYAVVVAGYVIMRMALVSQWLRAARSAPELRRTAHRYAGGICLVQLMWLARLLLPEQLQVVTFVALAVGECCVPIWAERRTAITWHPGHIADRYGCFTLIVLGETVLATTNALVSAGQEGHPLRPLLVTAASGLVLLASMWWVYFDLPQGDALTRTSTVYVWGYGHYVVFAAAAGVSAGLEVAVTRGEDGSTLGPVAAAAATSVPAAIFLLAAWVLLLRPRLDRASNFVVPALAVLVGFGALAPGGVVAAAVLAAGVVICLQLRHRSEPATT